MAVTHLVLWFLIYQRLVENVPSLGLMLSHLRGAGRRSKTIKWTVASQSQRLICYHGRQINCRALNSVKALKPPQSSACNILADFIAQMPWDERQSRKVVYKNGFDQSSSGITRTSEAVTHLSHKNRLCKRLLPAHKDKKKYFFFLLFSKKPVSM